MGALKSRLRVQEVLVGPGSHIVTDTMEKLALFKITKRPYIQVCYFVVLTTICCVATRPHMINYILGGYPNYARVETKGFTPEIRDKYIMSCFSDNAYAGQSLISSLEVRIPLKKLASIPIITQMLCILWKHQGSLPERITDLYDEFSQVLVRRRIWTGQDASQLMECVLDGLGRIALHGLLRAPGGKLIFSAEKIDPTVLKHGCDVGFVQEESSTSELNVKRAVTFLHKSFQEYCATRQLCNMVDADENRFRHRLATLSSTNIEGVELLLRFCCGTSVYGAGLILEHVNKMQGDKVRLQRLAPLLLFESGSEELATKLDRPNEVACKSHEDLVSLCFYVQHVPQPLEETDIQIQCHSIVDLRLLKEVMSVETRSMWVMHILSAHGKKLQLLEETLGGPSETVGVRYCDRLRVVLCIVRASWFDAEYVAWSLICMSHHINRLGLHLVQRLPGDITCIANTLTGCALKYLGLYGIDMRSKVTHLAPAVSSLTVLVLEKCKLVDDDVKDLISILPAGYNLRVPDLSGNSFSLAALEALAAHLCGFPQLREFRLSNIGLNSSIVKEVVSKNLPHLNEQESGRFVQQNRVYQMHVNRN